VAMTLAPLPLLGWLSWFGALGFLCQGGLISSLSQGVGLTKTCGGSRGWSKPEDSGSRIRGKTPAWSLELPVEGDHAFQVSRSFLAGTCSFGVWGCVWTAAPRLALVFCPPTAGRGRGWQRGQLLCVRGNGLSPWLLWWCDWTWGPAERFSW